MTCYDDAEGMLQDQGLEVVVIPYRPSPPPRLRLPKHKANNNEGGRQSPDENIEANIDVRRRHSLPSPASEESKSCDEDCEDVAEQLFPSPPPKPPMDTPRTQAAVAEALGQPISVSPPPTRPPPPTSKVPLKTRSSKPPLAEKGSEKPPLKSQSQRVGPPRGRGDGGSTSSSSSTSNTKNNNIRSSKQAKQQQQHRSSGSSSSKQRQKVRDPNKKLGLYQMAKIGYQELCNAIIRPPRSKYPMEALGPEEFVFCNEKFVRKDFGVVNERGLLLECSMWKRAPDEQEDEDEDEVVLCNITENSGNDMQYDEQSYEDDDGHGYGQITLNVDDWDENKEKGQMYLHVPESFDESLSCSSFNEIDCFGGLDDVEALVKDDCRDESPQGPSHASNFRHPHSETTARTYYQGTVKTRKRRRDPVVIYLHGNSSGRVEVLPQLGHLLSLGVSVVAFDFAGSGKSEGEFVSLGYYEREDLQTVIHHLRASGEVSTIALWGRSMGAATAIMYGSRDPTISGMILDSPFTDLTSLAEEMVEKGKEQGVNVPNFVVSVALRMIKSSIKSQAGFSIRHLSPISHANRCFTPAMFVAGEHDDFINKRHSELLHDKYAGDKNLVVVDGDHNSPRPRFLLQSACLFLQSCMQLPPSSELVVPLGTNLFAPPWISPGTFRGMGLGELLQKARAEASSPGSKSDRHWLPLNDDAEQKQQQQPLQRQRSQPSPSKRSNSGNALKNEADPPPGLPFEKGNARSRSVPDAQSPGMQPSPTAADFLEASAPPDMSARQKEIQSSLFKMLGQHE